MTLFANSGVTWPNLEKASRDAGASALGSGGKLFEWLKHVEQGNFSNAEKQKAGVADAFAEAADGFTHLD
jgi:hypothetical protein